MTDVLEAPAPTEAVEDYRSMTLLNEMGDIEVTWDSQNDDAMREVIERKMKEGVRFFILKPFPGGFLYRKTALKTMAQLTENRVKIGDADVEKLFVEGKVEVVRTHSGATLETVGIAKDAKDAATKRTVGVRPLQGG